MIRFESWPPEPGQITVTETGQNKLNNPGCGDFVLQLLLDNMDSPTTERIFDVIDGIDEQLGGDSSFRAEARTTYMLNRIASGEVAFGIQE